MASLFSALAVCLSHGAVEFAKRWRCAGTGLVALGEKLEMSHVLSALMLWTVAASAGADSATWEMPRTGWGDPDLSGIWSNETLHHKKKEEHRVIAIAKEQVGATDQGHRDQRAHECLVLANASTKRQPERNRREPCYEVEKIGSANGGYANNVSDEEKRDRIAERFAEMHE